MSAIRQSYQPCHFLRCFEKFVGHLMVSSIGLKSLRRYIKGNNKFAKSHTSRDRQSRKSSCQNFIKARQASRTGRANGQW